MEIDIMGKAGGPSFGQGADPTTQRVLDNLVRSWQIDPNKTSYLGILSQTVDPRAANLLTAGSQRAPVAGGTETAIKALSQAASSMGSASQSSVRLLDRIERTLEQQTTLLSTIASSLATGGAARAPRRRRGAPSPTPEEFRLELPGELLGPSYNYRALQASQAQMAANMQRWAPLPRGDIGQALTMMHRQEAIRTMGRGGPPLLTWQGKLPQPSIAAGFAGAAMGAATPLLLGYEGRGTWFPGGPLPGTPAGFRGGGGGAPPPPAIPLGGRGVPGRGPLHLGPVPSLAELGEGTALAAGIGGLFGAIAVAPYAAPMLISKFAGLSRGYDEYVARTAALSRFMPGGIRNDVQGMLAGRWNYMTMQWGRMPGWMYRLGVSPQAASRMALEFPIKPTSMQGVQNTAYALSLAPFLGGWGGVSASNRSQLFAQGAVLGYGNPNKLLPEFNPMFYGAIQQGLSPDALAQSMMGSANALAGFGALSIDRQALGNYALGMMQFGTPAARSGQLAISALQAAHGGMQNWAGNAFRATAMAGLVQSIGGSRAGLMRALGINKSRWQSLMANPNGQFAYEVNQYFGSSMAFRAHWLSQMSSTAGIQGNFALARYIFQHPNILGPLPHGALFPMMETVTGMSFNQLYPLYKQFGTHATIAGLRTRNNPGNLMWAPWEANFGGTPSGTWTSDGQLAQFKYGWEGRAAVSHMLFGKGSTYSNLTIAQAINRYAPHAPASYLRNVLTSINEVPNEFSVSRQTKMSSLDAAEQHAMMAAIFRNEGTQLLPGSHAGHLSSLQRELNAKNARGAKAGLEGQAYAAHVFINTLGMLANILSDASSKIKALESQF